MLSLEKPSFPTVSASCLVDRELSGLAWALDRPCSSLLLGWLVLQIPTEACFFREVSLVVGLSEAPLFCAAVISCAFPSDTATVRSAHGNCTSRASLSLLD